MNLQLEVELDRNKQKLIENKKIVMDWMKGGKDDYTHAVTLSFPFSIKTNDEAEKYIDKFIRKLTKVSFNRRHKNITDKIKIAYTLHGLETDEEIHLHCAIRCPIKFEYEIFSLLIANKWRSTVSNRQTHVHIQPYKTIGWIGYCNKHFTERNTLGIGQYSQF